MQIFDVHRNSAYTAAYTSSQQTNSSSSNSDTSLSGTADSGFDATKAFMDYANETPAQRMFDSWLGTQHVTKEEYNSMSDADKQKLVDKFEEYMKEKMREKLSVNSTSGSSSSAA